VPWTNGFSLVIAGIAFCGSHVLLSSTRLRGALRDQLGERGFIAVLLAEFIGGLRSVRCRLCDCADDRAVAAATIREDAIFERKTGGTLRSPGDQLWPRLGVTRTGT
jgi:hypothetical protein